MKKQDIAAGKVYLAKVSGQLVRVRVDEIIGTDNPRGVYSDRRGRTIHQTVYLVTNLTTGRATTFRSAARFRKESVLQ